MDPVDSPQFNIHTWREPNVTTMAQMRQLARSWRTALEEADGIRDELHRAVVRAKDAGHSFAQIREATGMGTGTIQMILAKAGR